MDNKQITALGRIPLDDNGQPQFERATIEETLAALVEMNDGNEAEAMDTAQQILDALTNELQRLEKLKTASGSTDVMEIQRYKKEYREKSLVLKDRIAYWTILLWHEATEGLRDGSYDNSFSFNGKTLGIQEDENGVLYSEDGKVLLKCTKRGLTEYKVKDGTKVICDRAFEFCEMASVTLPDSLVMIGDEAFLCCACLVDIKLPESLLSLGGGVFDGCTLLSELTLPKNLRMIRGNPLAPDYHIEIINLSRFFKLENDLLIQGDRVIAAVENRKEFFVPDHVTSIGECAFEGCNNLMSIHLPAALIRIESGAFIDCKGLKEITLPSKLKSIGEDAFNGCIGLTSIELPDGITKVETRTFADCECLKDIQFPESITLIGAEAFKECSDLESVEFPNNLISIGESSFEGCERLTSIEMNKRLASIGNYSFYECTDLESVDIPDSVTEIGDGAFEGCSGLESVKIGNSVTHIGKDAFKNCTYLTELTWPCHYVRVDDYAFDFCVNLEDVYVHCPKDIDEDIISEVRGDIYEMLPWEREYELGEIDRIIKIIRQN